MADKSKYDLAAVRVRGARNRLLNAQVATIDLARLASSDAARLDFPETRAQRLVEELGRSDLDLERAVEIYRALEAFITIAEDLREARSQAAEHSPGESDRSATTPEAAELNAEAKAGDQDAVLEDLRRVFASNGLAPVALVRGIQIFVRIQAEKSRSGLMLESLLLSSVAQFEAFVARLVRASLALDPSPLDESGRVYTISQIAQYGSPEALRDAAIKEYVRSLMYKGVDEWMKFLARVMRCDTAWVTDLLAEVVMRRNVHVHAEGRASAQYLEELGAKAAVVKEGDELPVTFEYLEDALNRMARAAIVLSQAGVSAICAGAAKDKAAGEPPERDDGVVDASFRLLAAKRHGAVESLAVQLEPFVGKNSTRERLRANSFAARKSLYGLSQVQSEIAAWDVSAAEDELVLAKHCLLEEIDQARAMYARLRHSHRISEMELATWPILEPLRTALSDEAEPKPETAHPADAEEDPDKGAKTE